MSLKLRAWTFIAALAVLMPAASAAQQFESRIIGKVLDQANLALPGVTVNATSKETGQVRSAVTDGDGSYAITNLSPGTYVLVFDLLGFAPETQTVMLGMAQVQTTNVTMGVAAVTETVMVSAESPVLDISRRRSASTYRPKRFRTCRSMVATSPT